MIPATNDISSITFEACDSGYYINSGTCTQCPVNSECDATSSTSCGSGTYSLLGWGDCAAVPWGQEQGSGGLVSCSSPEYYDSATGACKSDCPSGVICDPLTGEQSVCEWGQKLDPTTKVCSDCTAGQVCNDGVTQTNASGV